MYRSLLAFLLARRVTHDLRLAPETAVKRSANKDQLPAMQR